MQRENEYDEAKMKLKEQINNLENDIIFRKTQVENFSEALEKMKHQFG